MGPLSLLRGGGAVERAPPRGQLKATIRDLAAKTWIHPVHGREVRFSAITIERWYHKARKEKDDPVGVLRRAVRKDCGKVSLPAAVAERLRRQYQEHPHWSYQLHYDNLAALVKAEPALGALPSYTTVRRYLQAHGLVRKPRPRPKGRAGEVEVRRQAREVRSFEAEYVGSLWHLDFHHGSLKVLTPRGQWQRPLVLAILDDHSRLCCHLQWYLSETAEDLVHGLSQAIQKRGLPRALMTDNGSAMLADEFTEGLLRLGIVHDRTLPYSAYQNGKQESFWGNVEGRLLEMLDGYPDLTLAFLNEATQAWVEIEYNRARHRELSCAARRAFRPLSRRASSEPFERRAASGLSPGGEAASAAERRHHLPGGRAFRGAGTLPPLPRRPRPLRPLGPGPGRPRRCRGRVAGPPLSLDRAANADGRRGVVQPTGDDAAVVDRPATGELPPLLRKILADYSATGLPSSNSPRPGKAGSSLWVR